MFRKLKLVLALVAAAFFAAPASAQLSLPQPGQHKHNVTGAFRAIGKTFLPKHDWHPTKGQRARFWTSLGVHAAAVTVGAIRAGQSRVSSPRLALISGIGVSGGLLSYNAYKSGRPGLAIGLNLGLASEHALFSAWDGPPAPRRFTPTPPPTVITIVPGPGFFGAP